jgi:hypothetical protein
VISEYLKGIREVLSSLSLRINSQSFFRLSSGTRIQKNYTKRFPGAFLTQKSSIIYSLLSKLVFIF